MSCQRYLFLALCSFQVIVHASQEILTADQASQTDNVHMWACTREIDDEYLLKVPSKESEDEKSEMDKKTTELAVKVASLLKKFNIPNWKFSAELVAVQRRIELAEKVRQEDRERLASIESQSRNTQRTLNSRSASPRPLRRYRSAEDGLTRDSSFSPADSLSASSPVQFSSIKEEPQETDL